MEADAPGRVHKGESQILRHNPGIQIFSPALGIGHLRRLCQMLFQLLYLLIQREIQRKPGKNLGIAGLYPAKRCMEVLPGSCLLIAFRQKVRHLDIFRKPLSRRGYHQDSSVRVC